LLYCYDTGGPPDLNDVHSIVRKSFKEKVAVSVEGNRIYVATSETPQLRPDATFDMLRLPEDVTNVELSCNVVFDSKSQGIFRKEWRTHEAFAMFTAQAGLKSVDAEIYNLGLLETHKFTIRTAFRIYGEFSIIDRERFDNAYFNGVGGRRSYGFGLIIIKNFK
jgi:hypothetical protein